MIDSGTIRFVLLGMVRKINKWLFDSSLVQGYLATVFSNTTPNRSPLMETLPCEYRLSGAMSFMVIPLSTHSTSSTETILQMSGREMEKPLWSSELIGESPRLEH